MTPDTLDELIVCLGIFSVFLIVLGVGGVIADYILPRIPFLKRYADSLPDYEDDNEIASQYEAAGKERLNRCREGVKALLGRFF